MKKRALFLLLFPALALAQAPAPSPVVVPPVPPPPSTPGTAPPAPTHDGGVTLDRLRGGFEAMSETAYRNCVKRVKLLSDDPNHTFQVSDHQYDYERLGPGLNAIDEETCSNTPDELAIRFNQAESQQQFMNELEVCTVDSLDGKSDDECTGAVGTPNCVGATGAVEEILASVPDPTCVPTPTAPCPFFSNGVRADVWVDSAERHLKATNVCIQRRFNTESAIATPASVDEAKRELAMLDTGSFYRGPPGFLPNLYASPKNSRSRADNKTVVYVAGPVDIPGGGGTPSGNTTGASRMASTSDSKNPGSASAGVKVPSRFALLFDAKQKFVGDDGSRLFGLENGTLLERVGKGERLRDVLKDSPVAKKLSAAELVGKLGEESKEETDAPSARIAMTTKQSDSASDPAPKELGNSIYYADPDGSGLGKKSVPSAPRSLASAPLYLELNIFERVGRQYRSRAEDFIGTDFYLGSAALPKSKEMRDSPFKLEGN